MLKLSMLNLIGACYPERRSVGIYHRCDLGGECSCDQGRCRYREVLLSLLGHPKREESPPECLWAF